MRSATSVQWSLDAAGRLACARQATAGSSDSAVCGAASSVGVVDRIEHYGDEASDSPLWSSARTGTGGAATLQHTWYAAGLDGSLAATVTTNGSGTVRYRLSDLHGDLTATTGPDPAGGMFDGTVSSWDVWGRQLTGSATRHGWLGAKQRTQDVLTGLTVMGVRLYNPATGLFLQPDPVYGGNDNTYTYPPDPINKCDASGLRSKTCSNLEVALANAISKFETRLREARNDVHQDVLHNRKSEIRGHLSALKATRGTLAKAHREAVEKGGNGRCPNLAPLVRDASQLLGADSPYPRRYGTWDSRTASQFAVVFGFAAVAYLMVSQFGAGGGVIRRA